MATPVKHFTNVGKNPQPQQAIFIVSKDVLTWS